MASKRHAEDSPDSDNKRKPPIDSKPKCFFGLKCYRRNPEHFKEYSHPHLENLKSPPDEDTSTIIKNQWQIVKELNLLNSASEKKNETALAKPALVKVTPKKPTTVKVVPAKPAPVKVPPTKPEKSVEPSKSDLFNCPICNHTCDETSKLEEHVNRAHFDPVENPTSTKKSEDAKNDYIETATKKSDAIVNKPDTRKHPLLRKLELAQPFNMFFTKVQDIPSTHKDKHSLFLTDLLHSCHGELKSTLQINFLVDYQWLKMSYEATGNEQIPLLILYGEENQELHSNTETNVKAIRIRTPTPYGTHHTKLMVLVYSDDSVRIVVSTANLVPSDWENRTQGLWVSPKCPATLPGQTPKDSVTGFKASLLRYLMTYQVSQLHSYMDVIKSADFSSINAFFIASSPGSHQGPALSHFGHMAARSVFRKHDVRVNWPLIIQCSSIGSLGQTPTTWCTSELKQSLGSAKDVQVIYPSKKNVMDSLDGLLGGGCLPYRKNVHEKQPWLRDYLYQWKCDKWSRTRAMPHIKTYSQVQDKKAAYALLTSANLSKAAWGKLNKDGDKLHIM